MRMLRDKGVSQVLSCTPVSLFYLNNVWRNDHEYGTGTVWMHGI